MFIKFNGLRFLPRTCVGKKCPLLKSNRNLVRIMSQRDVVGRTHQSDMLYGIRIMRTSSRAQVDKASGARTQKGPLLHWIRFVPSGYDGASEILSRLGLNPRLLAIEICLSMSTFGTLMCLVHCRWLNGLWGPGMLREPRLQEEPTVPHRTPTDWYPTPKTASSYHGLVFRADEVHHRG